MFVNCTNNYTVYMTDKHAVKDRVIPKAL